MPEWWTKRSLPGSSGVMKPKPLSSLNHLTVPVAILIPSWDLRAAIAGGAGRQRRGRWHSFAGAFPRRDEHKNTDEDRRRATPQVSFHEAWRLSAPTRTERGGELRPRRAERGRPARARRLD